jgi:hypothetical protein
MPTSSDPYVNPRTPEQSYDSFVRSYRARQAQGNKVGVDYRGLGQSGAIAQGTVGIPAEMVGLNNLYQLLIGQGRVDPRLLASAQAQNARSTQQQKDAARAGASRSGLGNSGLSAALQAAIGSAGANRATNLNYQDIADSYSRNQQNLGLLDQLVIQPQLGYAGLGVADTQTSNQLKAAKIGGWASLLGGASRILGG